MQYQIRSKSQIHSIGRLIDYAQKHDLILRIYRIPD